MEKNNVNPTNNQNVDLSDVKKMFTDYYEKKKAQQQAPSRKTREEKLAKFFTPRKETEIFRILPPKPGHKRIEDAFFHVATTNIAGGKRKRNAVIYCPAHNDPKVPKLDINGKPELDSNGQPKMIPAPCPLCAKYDEIIATQNPSIKRLKKEEMNEEQLAIKAENDKIYKDGIQWQAKKFYIIRGIDKGAEKDGVKFWRFKHNYLSRGTLDKLLPVLEQFTKTQQTDFSDPKNGVDLTILMTDSIFQGHPYKEVTAIVCGEKSSLSNDPLIARSWLEDNTTWREVFVPKRAPNVEPYEYLEMVAKGTDPYWEDTDANNKHWVFPGRPDLEEKANTRTRNNDASNNADFELASDLMDDEYPPVTISNITESKVGKYVDNAIDLGNVALGETSEETHESDVEEKDEYSDLPF